MNEKILKLTKIRKFGDEMDISKIVFNYKNKIKKHISNL